MMDDPTAYPLAWPPRIPRHAGDRRRARFGRVERNTYQPPGGQVTTWRAQRELTVTIALDRLLGEIRKLGGACVIVSTNIPTRHDGVPRSDRRMPEDPGVAVYFTLAKKPYCFSCDRWDRVADNLAAVAAHIAAMRGMARWGVGSIEQAFTGYLALPAPDAVDWRAEFPHCTTLGDVERTYRDRARALHTDHGGEHEAMVRLNRARDAARKELAA